MDDDFHMFARAAARRFLLAGLPIAIIGLGVFIYGRRLEAMQAHSEVQFALPMQLTIAGAVAVGIGALLAIIGLVRWLRTPRRQLPEARLPE